MKLTQYRFALVFVALLGATAVPRAQDAPKPAGPLKEHEWLQQFVGEWETDVGKGTENARMFGEMWMVAESKIKPGDMAMSGMLTLGFDAQKKKYVGTWIDTMTAHLWTYEGTLDASGKVLTLEAEGPNPFAGGKMSKFRDVHEFKSKDHKVLTSSILGDDGKWQSFLTVNYKRKK